MYRIIIIVYAKTNDHLTPTHNLLALAHQAGLQINVAKETQLKEITSWNINARYDDYKRKFYRKATREFTLKWLAIVKEHITWINKLF